MKNRLKLLILIPLLTACDDLFSPAIENIRDLDAMYEEPAYAQGILGNAYLLLPYSSAPNSDVATDDAVTNDMNSVYLRMATGSWSSFYNPISQWQGCKNAVQYLNIFLENVDKVIWAKDDLARVMYNDRLKGEAYGLRALYMYHLLLAHGGWTEDGKLLGVSILTKPETVSSDFNQARNTFQECIQQIYDDAEKAIELLPLDYGDINDSEIPAKYQALGVTNASNYNRVNGKLMRGRITGRIVEAIRAQAALLAASPAFNAGTAVTWKEVADYAAVVIERVNGLDDSGGTWYANIGEIGGLASGATSNEIIWRSNTGENLDLEKSNYPPSLYGQGRINPTQNLVDAFPMANGYPILHEQSGYQEDNPYKNRDPRLEKYIVINGSKQGPGNSEIITGTYGTNKDAINKESELSTRTGYYLRKLLRPDCNPDPIFNTKQKHYTAYIRYTELFLIYAEAANEANANPTDKGSHKYSAYDIIKAIRKRAGIDKNDVFLESIKNDKDKMRELIRNERRLELCFENFRFRDLRRWKEDLNETARGMQIERLSDGKLKYTPTVNVEQRKYKEYMYYGPIPYSEIQKWDRLEQNKGWK